MRRFIVMLIVSVSVTTILNAQHYPIEWRKYVSEHYISDIQYDVNHQNLPEADFLQTLTDISRTSLAKQIDVRIKDIATIDKVSTDENASVVYRSSTVFSTDLNLKLVEIRTSYNPQTKEGAVISYINKESALRLWINEINGVLGKSEAALSIAEAYIDAGFKDKAKAESEAALGKISMADEALFWLGVFGLDQDEADLYISRRHTLERELKRLIADLEYGTTICIIYDVAIFDKPYNALNGDIKSHLARDGCNFVENPSEADWIVTICATAREYNSSSAGSQTLYFSYVDAELSVVKGATGQRIYEDSISAKGGHGAGYHEAARVAYKKISNTIKETIYNTISNN